MEGRTVGRLQKLLNRAIDNMTQASFARKVGVADSIISRWRRGITRPTPEMLRRVAEASDGRVTYEDLLEAAGYLERHWEVDSHYYDEKTQYVFVPLLGTVRGGDPMWMEQDIEGYLGVDSSILRGEGFALWVRGDSMAGDRIQDGDIVIVRRQDHVDPGDIAVVAIDGEEATIKRVRFIDDKAVLVSSNPVYDPIIVEATRIRILGKVVEIRITKP